MYQPPEFTGEPSRHPTQLADWVELNLLTQEENWLSVDDVTDELADEPPDNAAMSETREGQEDDNDDGAQATQGFEAAAENQASAAFSVLSERSSWLGNRYPLEVNADVALLHGSAHLQDIYRFLVLLRARQLYPMGLGDDGEEAGWLFEELAKHAIGAYVGTPTDFRVRFGVAGGSRGDGLALPIGEAVDELCGRMHEESGTFDRLATGDFRGDALAWKPFGDNFPGQLIVVCQATISERRWYRKQPANEWTDKRPPESRLIRFIARPVTAVAFPETLSLIKPDEFDGLSFSSIPFDRLRLLSALYSDPLPDCLLQRMDEWGRVIMQRIPTV